MNNECVIGIDIGGTNIRIGRTDENDQLVDFERVSSKETFKDGNISESLTEVLKNYLDKYCKNVQVKQIAIGIPATLSSDRKQILQVPNINGWSFSWKRIRRKSWHSCCIGKRRKYVILLGQV